MAQTRPTADQVRFNSSANGEVILDYYMEAVEKGGRSLPDLLDELFDISGKLKQFFELRENPLDPGKLQIRFGTYVDPDAGWTTFTQSDFNQFVIDAVAARDAAQAAEANASTSETNAATSATSATTSATNAATSASNAATSETNAAAIQGYAQEWADKAENILVSAAAGGNQTTDYSALHHASKSAQSAAVAATSASNAATSESVAATSATNAATSATNAATSAANALTSETNAAASLASLTTEVADAAASAASAAASAANALTSETNAATSATNAATSASNAATSETNAATSATNAAASELSASDSALLAATYANTNGTSTTSLTVSAIQQTLTTETSRGWVAGQSVRISYTIDATNTYMTGTVVSYNPTTGSLVVDVLAAIGTGTYADWTISLHAAGGDPAFKAESFPNTLPIASGTDSIAVGDNATSTASNALSIGTTANTHSANSIALGNTARVESASTNGIAIGEGSWATSPNAIAIGSQCYVRNVGATAANCFDNVSIGGSSTVYDAQECCAYGFNAEASGGATPIYSSVALGASAITWANKSTLVGAYTYSDVDDSICVGYRSVVGAAGGTAIGSYADANGLYSIAIGSGAADLTSSDAKGDYSIALGYNSYTDTDSANSIAIGKDAESYAAHDIVIGSSAYTGLSSTGWNLCIGDSAGTYTSASAICYNNIVLGIGQIVDAHDCIAIGSGANVTGSAAAINDAVAIGSYTTATGNYSIAIGGGDLAATSADATADYAIALGYNTLASALNSVAIGANVESTVADTFVGGTSATNKFTFSAAGMSIPAGTFTANGVAAEMTSNKGVANGYASLDASSKIPTAQLPALALTDINLVANEAAQLALVAQEGDIAIRSDLNKTYAHNGGVTATMADWSELLSPTDAVASVDGRTGTVTLSDLYEAKNANIQTHIASTSNPHSVTPAQIGAQATITGGATTITSTNLTISRALASDASGKVAVSATTSTELGYLSGVTSAIQTQINSKSDTSHTHSYLASGTSTQTGYFGRIYPSYDNSVSIFLDYPTGNYGSIQINGGGAGGYEGFSIDGRAVFMHDGTTSTGIYNDVDNQWMFYGVHNSYTSMYHGATSRFETTSTGAAVNGALTATGNITAYFSDERLKTKDGDIADPLGMLRQLDTFFYFNNDLAKSFGFSDTRRQVGLSAQQVNEVLPEVVSRAPFDLKHTKEEGFLDESKSGEDYMTVQYDRIVPLTVAGINKLDSVVSSLLGRIEELEAKIKQMEGK